MFPVFLRNKIPFFYIFFSRRGHFIKWLNIIFHLQHPECILKSWVDRLGLPAQHSLPLAARQPCGKQVRSCQSNGRLQQEETGLNRCEQLPTAAQLSLRIHCATPQSLQPCYDHQLQHLSTVSRPLKHNRKALIRRLLQKCIFYKSVILDQWHSLALFATVYLLNCNR